MKIAVVNLIGNIGKSTISSNLLFPRMGISDQDFISVETSNSGAEANGIDVVKMKGKKFGDLFDKLLRSDSMLVDVGSSNADDFLKYLQQFSDSHEEFDYFVIPVTEDSRAQDETLKTVEILRMIGVEKDKIRIVFNRMEVEDFAEIPQIFQQMFFLSSSNKSCVINKSATIFNNEVFGLMRDNGLSLDLVNNDDTDYRAKRREAKSAAEVDTAITMIKIKSLAKTANNNFNDVYEVLFK